MIVYMCDHVIALSPTAWAFFIIPTFAFHEGKKVLINNLRVIFKWSNLSDLLSEENKITKKRKEFLPWLRNTWQWQLGWRYTSPGHEADHWNTHTFIIYCYSHPCSRTEPLWNYSKSLAVMRCIVGHGLQRKEPLPWIEKHCECMCVCVVTSALQSCEITLCECVWAESGVSSKMCRCVWSKVTEERHDIKYNRQCKTEDLPLTGHKGQFLWVGHCTHDTPKQVMLFFFGRWSVKWDV